MGRIVTAYAYKYPAKLPPNIDSLLSFLWAFLNKHLPNYVVYGTCGKRNLAAMFSELHEDCTIAYVDNKDARLYGMLESQNLVGYDEHVDQAALEQLWRMQNPKAVAFPKYIIIDMLLTQYRVAEAIVWRDNYNYSEARDEVNEDAHGEDNDIEDNHNDIQDNRNDQKKRKRDYPFE